MTFLVSLPVKDDLAKRLGERVKDLRKKKHLTQEILGERAMVSYKFIGEIERGVANPSIDILSRIADALEVSLRDLFFFPDEAERGKPIYQEPRIHGSPALEAMKRLIPAKDIKRQRQVLKALKLLRAAFKN